MKPLARMMFAAGALTALLGVACSSPQASPAPGGDGPGQPKVNRVVFGVEPPTDESNNPRHINATSMWHLSPEYENLIDIDRKTGQMIPGLATEWQVLPDGSAIRFTLRQGVRFHNDMGEFTSADVVHSWWDQQREDSQAGYQVATTRKAVSETVANGPYEALVKFKSPDSDMLNIISRGAAGWEIQSKANYDKLGHDPSFQEKPVAGTAPYQFKERAQGQFIRYERVPYQHWRVTPDFPEFEFRWMKEASTRVASILTGEIQVTTLPEDLMQQAVGQGMKIAQGPVPAFRSFVVPQGIYYNDPNDPSKGFMYPNSPIMDVRVRKALSKAIDRDALNKAFFGGKGAKMIVDPMHPTRPGWDASWEARYQDEYGYDPTKAKQMLEQAGYGAGKQLETNIHIGRVAGLANAEDLEEGIANMWRAVGVKVNQQVRDTSEMSKLRQDLKFDNHWGVVATSATGVSSLHYHSTNPQRGNKMEDADIQKLVLDISGTLDPGKQEEQWHQLGELVFQRAQTLPLFWLPAEAVIDPKIVSAYEFPGSISGTWTHVEYIKAAK